MDQDPVEQRLPPRVALAVVVPLVLVWGLYFWLAEPTDWMSLGLGFLTGVYFMFYVWAYHNSPSRRRHR